MPAFARSLPADQAHTAATLPARAAALAGSAPSSAFEGHVCPKCLGSGHARAGVCRRCRGDGWLLPRRLTRRLLQERARGLLAMVT